MFFPFLWQIKSVKFYSTIYGIPLTNWHQAALDERWQTLKIGSCPQNVPEALQTPAQLTHFKVMLNDCLDQRMRFFKHFYFKPGRNRLLTDSFIQKHLVNVRACEHWESVEKALRFIHSKTPSECQSCEHWECRNECSRRRACPQGV